MSFDIGHEFNKATFFVNREKLRAYADASGDQNPIHQDEDFAKSVGLPNVIAHGMYTMALAGEAVRSWIGDDKSIIEFSTRFTKPVVVPENQEVPIEFTGKIVEANHGEIAVEVSALCEGIKVLGQTRVRAQV